MRVSTLFILTILLTMVSCRNQINEETQATTFTKNTIRLNFADNIFSINPLEATNDTEVFANNLLYYKLAYKQEFDLLNYSFDSLRMWHKFVVDTSKIATKDIQIHFKYLLKNHFHVKQVHDFFMAIQGIDKSIWLKSTRNILDSLPDGLTFINPTYFFIKSQNKQDKSVLSLFDSPYAYLTDSTIQKPFYLKASDNDISYQFYRETNQDLQNIELTFIKSKEQTISDFFNGTIDIITYQPFRSTLTEFKNRLDGLIIAKYPDYQVHIGNRAIVIYALIKEKKQEPQNTILPTIDSLDSSVTDNVVNIPVYNATNFKDLAISFDFEWHWSENDSEKSYPNTKYVVISEMMIDDYEGNYGQVLRELKSKDSSFDQSQDSIVVQTIYPEYYLSNVLLKGMKNYQKLSALIPVITFEQPKTY